jgi:uncharacterized membrane protein
MRRRAEGVLLSLALALAGCVGYRSTATEIDEHACPDDSELDYANFGEPFLAENCQTCHASDSEDRHGAPAAFTFDTVEQVREHSDRMFVRAAADNTSMPPGPDDPPPEAREMFADWLACGAP